jgi:prevent-host-death family protein
MTGSGAGARGEKRANYPDRLDARGRVNHICFTMRTATVRDLRTKFPVLVRWMEDGEEIEITRRGRVIARLTPAAGGKTGTVKKPDIMKRLREIYGDYVMPEGEAQAILDYNKGDW